MITDIENWQIIKEHQIYAINSSRIFDSLKVGDKVVMYLIPKKICGLFTISDLSSKKEINFSNKKYKYYFELKPHIIPGNPLLINKYDRTQFIGKISIFKNTSHWGGVIMGKSILSITEEDYSLIESKFNKSKLNNID